MTKRKSVLGTLRKKALSMVGIGDVGGHGHAARLIIRSTVYVGGCADKEGYLSQGDALDKGGGSPKDRGGRPQQQDTTTPEIEIGEGSVPWKREGKGVAAKRKGGGISGTSGVGEVRRKETRRHYGLSRSCTET